MGDREVTLEDQMDTCKSLYMQQKERTSQAGRRTKVELDSLVRDANIPEAQLCDATSGSLINYEMPEDAAELANVKKLLFLNLQISIAQSILQNLLAQDAVWDYEDFFSPPNEQQQHGRIEHYQKATDLLRSIELSFKEVACIDSKFFGPVWKASLDIIKTYPKSCLGGVGAAGLLGALSGKGLVSLHIGFRGFLAWLFGEASALSGAFVGGVAGIVIAGAIVALIALHQRYTRSQEEAEAEDVRLIKERIAKIAKQELHQSDLVDLEQLFDNAFRRPVKLAIDESCPICFEHFPADGGNAFDRAIKAPNCYGNHMVHQKCLRSWQWKSGSNTCIICRQ